MDGENREMNGEGMRQMKLIGNVAAELEETKQSLEKAKEQSMVMAHCLSSLQEELHNTKKELQLIKDRQFSSLSHPHEKQQQQRTILFDSEQNEEDEDDDVKVVEADSMEFQKKRYVTFANPPAAVVAPVAAIPPPVPVEKKLDRLSSLKREKNKIKKTLIPLISGIFSKRKGN